MMRCIENAIAAGHLSRDEGNDLQRRVNTLLKNGLSAPETKVHLAADMAAAAQEKRRVTLLQEAKRAELEDILLTHRNARGENDPAQAIIYLLEHHGQARFADVEHRRISILAQAHGELEQILYEFRKGAVTGDKRRGQEAVRAKLDNVVREIFGEKSKDPRAKEMAAAFKAVAESLRQRFNAAGGSIPKLDTWNLPQHHDAEAMMKAGRKAWVDYMMQKGVLARHKMTDFGGKPLGDDDLRLVLGQSWERITSDGWIDREPSSIPYGKGPLYKRYADQRFIQFKDADAWLEYQRNFGGGDPYTAMMGYVARMSRDVAFMEILGPNPEAMKTWLQQMIVKQSAVAKPAAVVVAEQTAKLNDLIAKATGGAKYTGLVQEVGKIVGELQDLHRRVVQTGGNDLSLEARIWNQADALEALQRQIESMDAGKVVGRRSEVSQRLEAIADEIQRISGEGAPQLGGGLSRRNKQKLAQLRNEESRLTTEMEALKQQADTLGKADPKLASEIGRFIEAMRGDLARKAHADDLGAVETIIDRLHQSLNAMRAEKRDLDKWRRFTGEDAIVDAVIAQNRLWDATGERKVMARFAVGSERVAIAESLAKSARAMLSSKTAHDVEVKRLTDAAEAAWAKVKAEIGADPRVDITLATKDLPQVASDNVDMRRAVREVLRKQGVDLDRKAPLLPYQPEAEAAAQAFGYLLRLLKEWRQTSEMRYREAFAAEFDRISKFDWKQLDIDLGEVLDALSLVQANEARFLRPQGFRSVADPQSKARGSIDRFNAMWDLMRGSSEAPVNATVANVFQTGRNIMSAALLGQASISSLSDVAFQRAARKFMGLSGNPLKIFTSTIGMMATADRREAVRAGLIMDSALHVMQAQARYLEAIDTRSVSGYLADRVISYSGLAMWTQAGKHAFGMALQAEIAARTKLTFRELPELIRNTFDRHGITSADWDVIRKAALYKPQDGLELLRPNEIAKLDPRMLPGSFNSKATRDIAEKYLAMIHREMKFAVPEGSVRSTSMLKGGRPGTVAGELARDFAQFKSFGASVMLMHGGRIAREWQGGRQDRATWMAASLLLTGAMAGAVVMDLKDIVNGRDPRFASKLKAGELPGIDLWGGAMLQAGGLGILGDFLFSGVNRLGGGLSSFVVGPFGGQIDRIRDRTIGNVDELARDKKTNFGREVIATARDIMPGGSLWYLRLAKERWLMNRLEWMVDPESAQKGWRRLETSARKGYGTEYWWRPGEMTPRRAPNTTVKPHPDAGLGSVRDVMDYARNQTYTPRSRESVNVEDRR